MKVSLKMLRHNRHTHSWEKSFIIFRAASFFFIGNLSSQCPYVRYIFIPHAYSYSTQRDHTVPPYLHLSWVNIRTYTHTQRDMQTLKYIRNNNIAIHHNSRKERNGNKKITSRK